MDPLSISASVAGLLALATSVVSTGYALVAKLKDREQTIHALVGELSAFSGVLVGVQSLFRETDTDTDTDLRLEHACGDAVRLRNTFEACRKTLAEAHELLAAALKKNKLLVAVHGDALRTKGEALVAELERYKTFFIICLQIQHSLKTDATDSAVARMVRQLEEVELGQAQLRKRLEEKASKKMRAEIIQWLGATAEDRHLDTAKRRDDNTADWLFARGEFTEWLSCEASSYFWLQGTQGCGKTVIVSRVVDSIRDLFIDNDVILVHHYCSQPDKYPERVVGALISQILQQMESATNKSHALLRLFERFRFTSAYPDMRDLDLVWDELCDALSTVYVIIDGLDQLSSASELVRFFERSPGAALRHKVFVSSRPSVNLGFTLAQYTTVAVTALDIQPDIERHIRSRLHQLRIDTEPDADALVQELVSKADGMFLWVVCQLDYLSHVRTAIGPGILKALPRGLELTYEAVLLRLNEDDRELAFKILCLIMHAHTPLDPEELNDAVAIHPGMRTLQELYKHKLRRPSDILEICGCLVRQSKSTGRISLSHFSVYEFLSSPTLAKSRPNDFFIERKASEATLLTACLTFLNLDDSPSLSFFERADSIHLMQTSGLDSSASANTSFLQHAATSWCAYMNLVGADELRDVWPLLELFFNEERPNYSSWLAIVQCLEGEYRYPCGFSPIHVAAMHSLRAVAQRLLCDNPGLAVAATQDGRTALHIAAENGCDDIVELLVTEGVYTEGSDSLGRSPLHLAIQRGDSDIVQRLVNAGADVNAALPDGGTPLSIAIENSWDELAKVLAREAPAAAKYALPDGRTLLHVAAQAGSVAWILALISHQGWMLNHGDDNSWTPLHYAVDNGNAEAVGALMHAGATVAADKHGWTPLHAAVRRKQLLCLTEILDELSARNFCSSELSDFGRPEAGNFQPDSFISSTSTSGVSQALAQKYGVYYAPRQERSASRVSITPEPLFLAVMEEDRPAIDAFLKRRGLRRYFCESSMPACLEKAMALPDGAILQRLLPFSKKGDLSDAQLIKIIEERGFEVLRALRGCLDIWSGHSVLEHAAGLGEGRDIELASRILEIWPITGPDTLIEALCRVVCHPRCRVDLVRFLCHGASMFGIACSRRLPLVAAVTVNRPAAEFLIKERPALGRVNCAGENALLALVSKESLTFLDGKTVTPTTLALDFLIQHGVDPNEVDQQNEGFCAKAVRLGSLEMLDWALKHGVVADRRDGPLGLDTPLSLAASLGAMDMVELLVGHFLDSCGSWAWAAITDRHALRRAAPNGNKALLSVLIDAEQRAAETMKFDEAMQEVRNEWYGRALQCTLFEYDRMDSDWGAVEMLIGYVPDLDYAIVDGKAALHLAAEHGSAAHVIMMLQRGADVDGMSKGGETACDVAIRGRRSGIVKVLVEYGCPVRADYLATALDWQDHDLVARLVEARGLTIDNI